MKQYYLYPFFCLSLAILFICCSSDNPSGDDDDGGKTPLEEAYIHLKIGDSDISELFFPGKGGSYTIEVDSNEDIEFSDDKDWCEVTDKPQTSSNYLLEIKAKANDTSTTREATVTIKARDVTKKVTITQDIPRPISNPGAMACDAKAIASGMFVGWNLGNSLEAYGGNDHETAWGNPKTTKQMIDAVVNAGFNAIRIPVRWYPRFTDQTTAQVDEKWMDRVKEVVGYCLDNDVYVIINTHHESWLESFPFYKDSTEVYRKERILWTQIANAFKDYDERLLFAGTNEVHVPNEWGRPAKEEENAEVQNGFNRVFVETVRATGGNNTFRNLIIQTYCTNSEWGPELLVIPDDPTPNRLMVEVHYYDPWSYAGTEEDKFWGKPYSQYGIASWGQEDHMEIRFATLKRIFVDKGYPVIVGECGSNRQKDTGLHAAKIRESRAYYFQTLVATAKKYGAVPFLWDNGKIEDGEDQFALFDRNKGMKSIDVQTTNGVMKGGLMGDYRVSPKTRLQVEQVAHRAFISIENIH